MRKQWKISAQKLLTLSAFGILAGFSATSFSLTGLTNAAEQTKPAVIVASGSQALDNKIQDSIALAESMRVHIAFIADPLISATDISPSVKNGKMVLKGNVNNNEVSNNALALASRNTTYKVISEIRTWPVSFSKTTKISVEALQANTHKLVSTELLTSYPKLSVTVPEEGCVVVSGPVVTLEDKLEISKKLRKVQGCQRVVNKMTVQPMRMGNDTVTMVNKDGTKWIMGKDQIATPLPTIMLNPTPAPTKEIANAVAVAKPSDKIVPIIVPTQSVVQAPKSLDITNTNSKNQRPQVLPESLIPVVPMAKLLPTPAKAVDVLSEPKVPQDWIIKKSDVIEKKEAIKSEKGTVKKAPLEDKTKTVTKTVEAQTTSKSKEKVEEFPSFPNLNKKSEKFSPVVPIVPEPANKKEIPEIKQATPVPPKKEVPKVVDKKEFPKVVDKKEPVAPKIIVEKETMNTKVDVQPKTTPRVFMPAHDPLGSALVKTDMLGFPTIRKDAPAPETKQPLLTDKIPTKYSTNSDKDGEYNRPYLAAKTQVKPLISENMLAEKANTVASKPAGKQDKTTDIKPNASVASQPVVKKESTQNTAKVIEKSGTPTTTVSNDKNKTVPVTTASKKVESPAKPNVSTGTITFDSEEVASKSNSNQQMALNALKKQVEQACGKKASSVQVIEKPDGSRVLLIGVAIGSKQEDLAKTLFGMPEITENNVAIDFIIK